MSEEVLEQSQILYICLTKVEFIQVPREENMEVDCLSRVASTDGIMDEEVEIRYILSVDILEVQQVDGEANWTIAIISYLKDGLLK